MHALLTRLCLSCVCMCVCVCVCVCVCECRSEAHMPKSFDEIEITLFAVYYLRQNISSEYK
jgi:hypothetical protein